MARWIRSSVPSKGFKDVRTPVQMEAYLKGCTCVEPTLGTLWHLHAEHELIGTLLKLSGQFGDFTKPMSEHTFRYLLAAFEEITPPDTYPTFASIEYSEEIDYFRIAYKPGNVLEGRRVDALFGTPAAPLVPRPPEPPKELTIQISEEKYK